MSVALQNHSFEFRQISDLREITLKMTHYSSLFTSDANVVSSDLSSHLGTILVTERKMSVPVVSPMYRDEIGEMAQACVFDLDDVPEPAYRKALFKLSNFAKVVHSTHSNGAEKGLVRARAILILDRPVNELEYRHIHGIYSSRLSIKVDPSSSSVRQRFLLPSASPGNHDRAFLERSAGALIPVDGILANFPVEYSKFQAGEKRSRNGNPEIFNAIVRGCETYRGLIARLRDPAIHLSHIERFKIAQLALSIGMTDEETVNLFKHRPEFNFKVTMKNISSIRKKVVPPACGRLSQDLGICVGTCENQTRARNAKTPVGLIKWDLVGTPWEVK